MGNPEEKNNIHKWILGFTIAIFVPTVMLVPEIRRSIGLKDEPIPVIVTNIPTVKVVEVNNSVQTPAPVFQPAANPSGVVKSKALNQSLPESWNGYSAAGDEDIPAASKTPDPVQPPVEPWNNYSTEARQVIASEIAQSPENLFDQRFSIHCLSVSQSRRKFSGYGINSDVDVVSARFQISSISDESAVHPWSKTYNISETIDASQFAGLNNADTVQRIGQNLLQKIQEDKQSLAYLQTTPNPSNPK